MNPALAGIIYHCCAVNLLQKTKSSETRFYIRKRQKMKLWWSTVSINKEFSPPEGRQKKILNKDVDFPKSRSGVGWGVGGVLEITWNKTLEPGIYWNKVVWFKPKLVFVHYA